MGGGYCKSVKSTLFSVFFLTLLLLCTTFISCAGGAGSASGGAAAEGASLAIHLPDTSRTIYEKADIVSFTVTISSGSFNSTKSANKGETMMFSNLPAGNYSVKAYGKTSKGAVAAKCETSVTIVAGETTTTTLHLSRLEHWTVTFMNADGSTLSTQDISDGYKATKPADPAPVSGKLFSGWTTDAVPSDSSPLFNFNTPITGDTTLQPVFGVITYTVKYVSAAGDFADVSFTAATASAYELPSTSSVAGLSFDSWYSDANFTTAVDVASVRDITTFTKIDDIHYEKTIYAKWTAHVEFQGESSTGSIITLASDEDVTYGGKVTDPGTPTAPTGATFGGWYTGTFNAGTGKVTLGSEYDFNTAVTEDMILYAKWNYIMHNVTYISVPQDVPDGTETEFREIAGIPTLPTITPEADSGLTFVGWTDDENITLTTTPLPSVPANTTEDVTLYAIWKVQVIMNPNNGTAATQYDVIYNKTFNESVPSPIPTSMASPSNSGADSYEWYKTNSAVPPTDWSSATAFDKTAPITEKTYLHARWNYTVTFDSRGGSDVTAQTVACGEKATKPTNPTKTGFVFDSWRTGTVSGGTVTLAAEAYDFNTPVTENLTLYAQWAPHINNLSEYLASLPAGSKESPNVLPPIAGLTTSNWTKIKDALKANDTIYVDISATVLPSGITSMSNGFYNCKGLVKAPSIPSSVTNMYGCFQYCTNLTSAPVIPSNVTNMSSCFKYCTNLTSAPVIPSNVTNMEGCFMECSSLTTAPEIPKKVENMKYCFNECTSLTGYIIMNAFYYDNSPGMMHSYTQGGISSIPTDVIIYVPNTKIRDFWLKEFSSREDQFVVGHP